MTYTKTSVADEAVSDYSSKGLTSVQVEEKLEQFGENTLTKEKISGWRIFAAQIFNTLSFILIAASILAFIMKEYSDAVIIMTIVILNAFIGFIHEYRAGKAVEKLSDMIEHRILTVRDNVQTIVNAHYLVPGDVIILHAGDIVPADVKIIEAYDLTVNESQLTGESVPVNKDCQNSLYTDSVIESGFCKCIVYATGSQTELGKMTILSKNTKSIEKSTRYEKALADFSTLILRIIAVSAVLMIGLKAFSIHSAEDFTNTAIFAIAMAMTAIPEILPMITTVALADSAIKLAKQKVVVKRLSAIEELGRINILCTDKTGTLTQDCLSVNEIISDDVDFFQKLAYIATGGLYSKDKDYQTDSANRALAQYIPETIKAQINSENWVKPEFHYDYYNSNIKIRRIFIKNLSENINKTYLIVSGTPDELLTISKISTNDMQKYMRLINKSRAFGMKQLAVAYKEIVAGADTDIVERDLIFLGFANLYDPLCSTAKSAIIKAKKLGVDVKILSGDSVEVTGYVGREAGLLSDGDKIYTGKELEAMSSEELDNVLTGCSVFARITPEQKYNIIERLQQNNNIVGYQGDGINDTPALKLANVAIAVNNSSDIAKSSADIVLLDDNLDVIIDGIIYGRRVFANVNKFIRHVVIGKMGNFFAMIFFYILFSADIPMLGVQLLIGNTIQDLALMGITTDNVDTEETDLPQNISRIESTAINSIIPSLFTAFCYVLFYIYMQHTQGIANRALNQTSLFLFYNLTQIVIIISARAERNFFWQGKKPSKFLLISVTFFTTVSAAVTYIPTTVGFMGFEPLPFINLAILTGYAIIYIVLLDLIKIIFRRTL